MVLRLMGCMRLHVVTVLVASLQGFEDSVFGFFWRYGKQANSQ